MAGFYPIKTEVDGRMIKGDWTLCQGNRICVRAPGYGPSLTVPLGNRKPEEFARRVLAIMVRCHYRREHAERVRQEREAVRLGGRRRRREPARIAR